MKQIIISFDEKGTSVFLAGNPTRSEVIGMLELSKQTMLKDVVLPVTTDTTVKELKKSKNNTKSSKEGNIICDRGATGIFGLTEKPILCIVLG